jgi:hypothetical protein
MGGSKHDHRGLLDVVNGVPVRVRHQQKDRSETPIGRKHLGHSLERSLAPVIDRIRHLLGLLLDGGGRAM